MPNFMLETFGKYMIGTFGNNLPDFCTTGNFMLEKMNKNQSNRAESGNYMLEKCQSLFW